MKPKTDILFSNEILGTVLAKRLKSDWCIVNFFSFSNHT
ncbi:hypothetical protein EV11_1123 [Prochlorococcus sp. SS52]|nr:hypothetical protein EV08_0916 [Prochlorococcus marinus str. SS2]KGG25113.1 hypothetical protein EV09_0007 [Prochlorococcus marinus str. SS35]KGG35559.1 hypothetical protein EV11_1123 [Prochlorococcus sp. SS52]